MSCQVVVWHGCGGRNDWFSSRVDMKNWSPGCGLRCYGHLTLFSFWSYWRVNRSSIVIGVIKSTTEFRSAFRKAPNAMQSMSRHFASQGWGFGGREVVNSKTKENYPEFREILRHYRHEPRCPYWARWEKKFGAMLKLKIEVLVTLITFNLPELVWQIRRGTIQPQSTQACDTSAPIESSLTVYSFHSVAKWKM